MDDWFALANRFRSPQLVPESMNQIHLGPRPNRVQVHIGRLSEDWLDR